ncbi:hypothetical protein KTH_47720 [Thermosporothrix hazakensis]|nr:hypothetical protein KTH_47720 [Thermosporothrix hazakensis]
MRSLLPAIPPVWPKCFEGKGRLLEDIGDCAGGGDAMCEEVCGEFRVDAGDE